MDSHQKFPSVKDRKFKILKDFLTFQDWQSDVSTTFAAYGVEHWLKNEVFEDDLSEEQKKLYTQAKTFMHNTIDPRHKSITPFFEGFSDFYFLDIFRMSDCRHTKTLTTHVNICRHKKTTCQHMTTHTDTQRHNFSHSPTHTDTTC